MRLKILDVGAIVELIGMAGGRVSNQEPDRPALLGRQRLAAAMVDDDALGSDGFQGHRDVKVVAVGVQGQVVRFWPRPRSFEDRFQRHAVTLALGVKPRNVWHLRSRGQRGQITKPQLERLLHRPVHKQENVAAHRY